MDYRESDLQGRNYSTEWSPSIGTRIWKMDALNRTGKDREPVRKSWIAYGPFFSYRGEQFISIRLHGNDLLTLIMRKSIARTLCECVYAHVRVRAPARRFRDCNLRESLTNACTDRPYTVNGI